jgi:hypothetical protein
MKRFLCFEHTKEIEGHRILQSICITTEAEKATWTIKVSLCGSNEM